MPRRPSVRRTDLDRVIAALKAAGQAVAAVELAPGGAVRMIVSAATPITTTGAPLLTVVGAEANPPATLDTWREQKRRRGGGAD